MAISISNAQGGGIVSALGGKAHYQQVDVLCDTEAEILVFGSGKGHEIAEGDGPHAIRVKPMPGSTAYTADMSVMYQLSPSYVWTKVV